MTTQELPEPMNATPHHTKVKVSIALADPTFVAGTHIGGKMTMECRADKGLGIGVIMVELFAVEELTSRDHSATTTFLHSQRIFQGPGLPPSNAVKAYPEPGDPPLPQDYHQARRGRSTFLFRLPLPENAPASVSFGGGLARVRYELRASVGAWWKGERRLVTSRCELEVVEAFDDACMAEPDVVVVAENGKFWMQGKVVGGFITAGESACVELQVKNHSTKKNTSLTLSLSRALVLASSESSTSLTNPNLYAYAKQPLQITDTITNVSFRGPEYVIHPGGEGVASLVFDVPKNARSVKGGLIGGTEPDEANGGSAIGHRQALDALFEVRCLVEIKMGMGLTSKDVTLSIPVSVIHPLALPVPLVSPGSDPNMASAPYPYPHYRYNGSPHFEQPTNPYVYPGAAIPLPASPPLDLYLDNNQRIWMPPPTPQPYEYYTPYAYQHPHPHNPYLQQGSEQYTQEPYYGTPPPNIPVYNPPYEYESQKIEIGYINRPSSAGPTPITNYQYAGDNHAYPGLPSPSITSQPLLPLRRPESRPLPRPGMQKPEQEEGKGERALRVSQHLRLSSRHRSVSPVSHRYPFSTVFPAPAAPEPIPIAVPGHNIYSPAHMLPPPPSLHPIDMNCPSISPSHSGDGMVHSPRPQLTPKHSFTSDRPKSVRVEELERMADEVGIRNRDLSGDLPKVDASGTEDGTPFLAARQPNLNKTLPGTPLPTKKTFTALLQPGIGPRLPDEKTPPTPTLTPLSAKHARPSGASHPNSYSKGKSKAFLAAGLAAGSSESGLDALERRLLAEVGTRKLDNAEPRPDVTSLFDVSGDKRKRLPPSIAIPNKVIEPLNDSAISSLTLADHEAEAEVEREIQRGREVVRAQGEQKTGDRRQDREVEPERLRARELELEMQAQLEMDAEMNDHDSDVKTHRAGQSSMSGDSGRRRGRARQTTGAVDAENKKEFAVPKGADEDKKNGKKKERTKEGGKIKSAKGRVAAWLGGIDITVPPPEDIIPPSPSVARAPRVPEEYATLTTPISEGPALDDNRDVSSAPNPRSSGFVAIGTLKQDSGFRPSTEVMTVVEEAKRIAEIWSSNAETNIVPDAEISVSQTHLKPDNGGKSPSLTLGDNAIRNLWKLPDPPLQAPPFIKKIQPSEHLMRFSSSYRKDPEVKHDIRSARGGRGGKVAAVASLWANAVAAERAPADIKQKSKYDQKLGPTLGEPSRVGRMAPGKSRPSVNPVLHQSPKVVGKAPALKDVTREPRNDRIQGRVDGVTSPVFVKPTRAMTASKATQKPLAAPLARKPNQLIKSTSVPAVISSSHAIPMLSSTASLARSQPLSPNTNPSTPALATSVPSPVESTHISSPSAPVQKSSGGMAFGQARLRDLIKKYQGQGA